eukprot:TRINITY_DN78537_c0_g1_i1.p1 TRINITY_DN78537_c0_g1~~TRINITY_DN78537_c0_g1_i1.p1  ORF type:complete len:258 (-),score=21.08 TRINITY_DN78537_c0_g1_i1:68-841(-)
MVVSGMTHGQVRIAAVPGIMADAIKVPMSPRSPAHAMGLLPLTANMTENARLDDKRLHTAPRHAQSRMVSSSPRAPRRRRDINDRAYHAIIWTEDPYDHFYARSYEERQACQDRCAGAGLSHQPLERWHLAWQGSGTSSPSKKQQMNARSPSVHSGPSRVARFQHAFGELSHGRGSISAIDASALLRQMNVSLPARQLQELVEEAFVHFGKPADAVKEAALTSPVGARRLSYEAALWLYTQALGPRPVEEDPIWSWP